jgi:hypothetical protein
VRNEHDLNIFRITITVLWSNSLFAVYQRHLRGVDMAWVSIDILCTICQHKWDDLVTREEMDNQFTCPECTGLGLRTISAPEVRTPNNSESYITGHTPAAVSGAMKNKREEIKLIKESYKKPWKERGEIKKEISRIQGVKGG